MIDYKIMDMPTHLSRTALKQDPANSENWIRDDSWYAQTKAINSSLYSFLVSAKLLKQPKHFKSIDHVVIMFSDLNEVGQLFLQSGAVDRWSASFDRPSSKKSYSDVRYLEKALRTIRSKFN